MPSKSFEEEPQVAALFETPVIVDKMPNAVEINRELARIILQRRELHRGVELSNIGGWQSDAEMLSWAGKPAGDVLTRIRRSVDQYTVDLRGGGEARFRWFPEMWANVSPPNSSNQYHTHPGAFWSAIYYVDDGYEGSRDTGLGGELTLLDPRMPAIRMNSPDLRFRRPSQRPDDHEKWMRPETGRIVIFPSWLSHAVRPYSGRSLRISIAINLTAVPVTLPLAVQ